ncbi:MAG: hypothetical protein FWD05_13000 [Oscillospiraceae bacterium]|nr:hypothetical protein [Oscillospiraceae bacterium]
MLRKTKTFVALVLILVACFGSAITVLAVDAITGGTAENPIALSINKLLRMPIGTTTPSATFNFESELIRVDGNTPPTFANPPVLQNLTVSFSSTDAAANPDNNDNTHADDVIAFERATGNIFEGVTFPHAGVFEFRITEEEDTNDDIDEDTHDFIRYSKASYIIVVHVANNTNENVPGATFVQAVGIFQERYDDGELVEMTPPGRKVPAMTFTNDFVRTNAPPPINPNIPEYPDPTDPDVDPTLFVGKTVTGDLGNRTIYFDFSVTIAVPSLVTPAPAHFRAYIVENGAVVNDVDANIDTTSPPITGTDPNGNRYIVITHGAATQFRLRHDQRLVFVDTPVGTSYTVTETLATGYTTSIVVTTNNSPVSVSNEHVLSTGQQRVGEPNNLVVFTNNRDFITPTGLSVNDLPFLVIVLLALGALTTFVVVKVRRRNYN